MSLFKKLTVLLFVVLLGAAVLPASAASAAEADDQAAYLRDMNALRASKGLPGFTLNAQLNRAAYDWALQMVANGKISHNPNLAKLGPAGWQKLGENVGVGGDETSLFNAFVASPGHYKNLIDAGFNQVGIAVVYANGRQWTVHMFMQSANTSPVATAAPKAPVESEASRYLRTLSDRLPAAANMRTLRGKTAVGL